MRLLGYKSQVYRFYLTWFVRILSVLLVVVIHEKIAKGGCIILYFYTITQYISCMENHEMDIVFIAC